MSVSPFVTDEVEADMLIASADSRFAAISNDVRVRVEGSKKRLMTVFPRRAGTFFIERFETSLNDSAASRIAVISSTVSSRMLRRSFLLSAKSLFVLDDDDLLLLVVVLKHHFDDFGVSRLQPLANIISLDRQFTVSTIDQNSQFDTAR